MSPRTTGELRPQAAVSAVARALRAVLRYGGEDPRAKRALRERDYGVGAGSLVPVAALAAVARPRRQR
jgi:hypothetical protein